LLDLRRSILKKIYENIANDIKLNY